MPDVFLFFIAAVSLTLAPGPDNIYVLTRGIAQGKKAGLVAALGFCSGLVFHTVLAVCGFSAIIKTCPVAYHVLQYAGGGYLIYLGVRTLRSSTTLSPTTGMVPVKLARIYRHSVIANMLNPKVTLFFIALLPQFVNAQAGNVPWQMSLLALVFIAQALVVFSAIAFFSGTVGAYFRRQARAALYLNRLAGWAFVGLGIRVALPE